MPPRTLCVALALFAAAPAFATGLELRYAAVERSIAGRSGRRALAMFGRCFGLGKSFDFTLIATPGVRDGAPSAAATFGGQREPTPASM